MSRLVRCLHPSERGPRGGALTSACSRRRRAAESESHGRDVRAFAAEALFVRRCLPSAMNLAKETLRELIALLTLAFFAGSVPSAFAKLGYVSEEETIRRAEIIAIVDISHVERAKTKSSPFDYNEIAYATVQQTLKGTLQPGVTSFSFFAIRICWSLATITSASVRSTELKLSGTFLESDANYLSSHSKCSSANQEANREAQRESA
jgi:hypothetical protein